MPRKGFAPAALSFLDTLSNGFGAIVLLFVIITARADNERVASFGDLPGEQAKLEAEVLEATKELARARYERTTAAERSEQVKERAEQLVLAVASARAELADLQASSERRSDGIAALQQELSELEAAKRKLAAELPDPRGRSVRSTKGDGERQYLTGMRVDGRHVLILVDRSASMLDETIVNVIRSRNLPKERQLQAPKWQRAVATVEWLTAQLPPDARFQVYGFNTSAEPILTETAGWLPVDRQRLDQIVSRLGRTVPEGGTSLHAAIDVIDRLSPRPDNVYLLVDGMPTQGAKAASGGTVTGAQRLEFFRQATRDLPRRKIALNVILFPMEGDPAAAPEYWWLSQLTGGSFLVPSRDWP